MRTTLLQFFLIQHFIKRSATVIKTAQCTCLAFCATITHAQEVKMYTGCNVVLSGNIYVVMNNTAFKNNGTFTAGSSTVAFTGNTDTSISFVSGSSNTRFDNLMLNKTADGIALKSPVGVKNVLTLASGNLYANSNLTLLSDSINTARLAMVPAGARVYGTAMVERYIPAKRGWRLMTAPVTNAASIRNSWQNAGLYTPGKGVLISGPSGAANGFDNSNTASLKKFNVSGQSFISVANTYASISATNTGSADNTGYFVFIRGDRNPINFIVSNSNVTTLTSIGSLQTGVQTFGAATVAGANTLIGNPYASPIDFDSVTRINLLKRFYVWDATLNTLGGYVTMDDVDNNGFYSKSVSGSSQTKQIQSSQAFFTETSGNGAASLTIDENAKSSTNNTHVFRPAGNETEPGTTGSVMANLYLLNTDGTLLLADGALAEFAPGFSDSVTNEDAIKFTNTNENIGFLRYSVTLSIERRPLINLNDTLFLKIWSTTQRSYQLQIVPENIDRAGLKAYLEDSYLVSSVPISLSGAAAINFTVDANAASATPNRFRIVFKQLSVLPIAFAAIKAYKLDDNIKVDWQVQGEINTAKYEVEKSANGSIFNLVNTTSTNATGTYSWLDALPFTGKNFYRIKSIGRNGAIKYSQVVYVLMDGKAVNFAIQPNPVKGSSIHLQFTGQPAGNYRFNLINGMGQLIFSTQVTISSSSTSQVLKSNTVLPAGSYQLQITGPSNITEIQKVIIQQ